MKDKDRLYPTLEEKRMYDQLKERYKLRDEKTYTPTPSRKDNPSPARKDKAAAS